MTIRRNQWKTERKIKRLFCIRTIYDVIEKKKFLFDYYATDLSVIVKYVKKLLFYAENNTEDTAEKSNFYSIKNRTCFITSLFIYFFFILLLYDTEAVLVLFPGGKEGRYLDRGNDFRRVF